MTGHGEVAAFGGAKLHGSASSLPLDAPIVDIAPTTTGMGYWLVAADGGAFAYRDAQFGLDRWHRHRLPGRGRRHHHQRVGYWVVTARCLSYAFGDAEPVGTVSGLPLDAPIVGAAS